MLHNMHAASGAGISNAGWSKMEGRYGKAGAVDYRNALNAHGAALQAP